MVYERTGSAAWVGFTGFAAFGLTAAVTPLAGALGDRLDRRQVMIGSDLAAMACLLAMVPISDPYALIALGTAAAICATPMIPVAGAALPALVPDERLAWANGRLAVAAAGAGLVGPLLGGSLVGPLGAGTVFAIDAATFLVSAALLATLPPISVPHGSAESRGLASGIRFLAHDRELRRATGGLALALFAIGLTLPAEVAVAEEFGAGPTGYGALLACWGVGGLFGAAVAGPVLARTSETNASFAMAIGVSVAFLIASTSPLFLVITAAFVLGGLCEGAWQVTQQVLLQRRSAAERRARVLAAGETMLQAAFAVPLLWSGFVVDRLGGQAVFALALAPCLASVLLLAPRSQTRRRQAELDVRRLD